MPKPIKNNNNNYICDFILNCWILDLLLIPGLQAVPKLLPLEGYRIFSRLSLFICRSCDGYWARYLILVPSVFSPQGKGGRERTLVTGLGNMIFCFLTNMWQLHFTCVIHMADPSGCKMYLRNDWKFVCCMLQHAYKWNKFSLIICQIPYGLVVRIRRSHRRGPGSIPGVGTTIVFSLPYFCLFLFIYLFIYLFYKPVVFFCYNFQFLLKNATGSEKERSCSFLFFLPYSEAVN